MQRVRDFAVDEMTQFVFGVVQTGGIDKDHLIGIGAQDAQLSAAGGLRSKGHTSNWLPHQLVKQVLLPAFGLPTKAIKPDL